MNYHLASVLFQPAHFLKLFSCECANARMRVQLNEIARKANGITSVVKYTEPKTKQKNRTTTST